MIEKKVAKLKLGLYILFWKSGGLSLAAVGFDWTGKRWYAPTNWINVPSFDWDDIESVKLILTQEQAKEYYDED